MRLPLKALETFESVARTRSFAKAASELGVTTAAITFQIRQFEQLVGEPLLIRDSGALELTWAGKRILSVSHKAFSSLDRVVLEFKPSATRLKITASPTFAEVFLHRRLQSFQDIEPHVVIEVEASPQVRDLSKDGFDAAVTAGWADTSTDKTTLLFPNEIAPMAAPSIVHAGAASDLYRLPLLRNPFWADWFAAAGLDYSLARESGPYFRPPHLGAKAAVAGEGVALLSPRLFGEQLRAGELVRLSPVALDTGMSYFLRIVGRRPRTRALEGFKAWLLRETEPLRTEPML